MDVLESPWVDSNDSDKQLQDGDSSQPTTGSKPETSTPSTSQAALSTTSSRPSRGPRRLVAQPTRLEAVDDPLGPLGASLAASDGPLSKDDEPPAPPLKEQVVVRTTMSQPGPQARRLVDPHRLDDDDDGQGPQRGPRAPPPVEAARPTGIKSSMQPSVSVEQAAKPTFHIAVGDPVKIGDLTSSHIVYSVRTRVKFTILDARHRRTNR